MNETKHDVVLEKCVMLTRDQASAAVIIIDDGLNSMKACVKFIEKIPGDYRMAAALGVMKDQTNKLTWVRDVIKSGLTNESPKE